VTLRATGLHCVAPLLCALAGCDGAAAIDPRVPAIRVAVSAGEVEAGVAFPLTIVRRWRVDQEPDAWDDAALPSLLLRPRGSERRDDGARVEESLRFDAYAFDAGDLTLPGVEFVVRGDDGVRNVASPPFALRVRPVLDPDDTSAPELPGDLLAASPPWPLFGAGATVFVVALALVRRRRRVVVVVAPSEPVVDDGPSPAERARARLSALRGLSPSDRAADQAFHAELVGCVRDCLLQRWSLGAPEWSNEELVADVSVAQSLGVDGLARLRTFVAGVDRVRFGGQRSDAARRGGLLDVAESLVARAPPAEAAA
jgi:hypothetical protein